MPRIGNRKTCLPVHPPLWAARISLVVRGGGPRTFDRDSAVETAMILFWRHGYEGVSISDLTDAIGIAPPSLYAAFGSKVGLYREALDLYATRPGALVGLGQAESLDERADSSAFTAAVPPPRLTPSCKTDSGPVRSGSTAWSAKLCYLAAGQVAVTPDLA